jgi:hypothetical protein
MPIADIHNESTHVYLYGRHFTLLAGIARRFPSRQPWPSHRNWIDGGTSGSLEASDGFDVFGEWQEIECGERSEA